MDECAPYGAKITFLSTGEFMEYVLADTTDGWPLMVDLYASGGTLGTHSHNERQFGTHDWRPIGPGAPLWEIIQMWQDHVDAVDAVITASLGVTDPNEILAINSECGTHMPSDDEVRIDLMEDFGFTMHQQGPDEQFYAYFEHYPMNPYRPSGLNSLTHDPNGPVVVSPLGPVIGHDALHFGIRQDMRLPAMKTRFLLHLLNWLDD